MSSNSCTSKNVEFVAVTIHCSLQIPEESLCFPERVRNSSAVSFLVLSYESSAERSGEESLNGHQVFQREFEGFCLIPPK